MRLAWEGKTLAMYVCAECGAKVSIHPKPEASSGPHEAVHPNMKTTQGVEPNTIAIDEREGLWRMRIYPDQVQLFPSRELAEAHARDLACSKIPPWTVIVRAPRDPPST